MVINKLKKQRPTNWSRNSRLNLNKFSTKKNYLFLIILKFIKSSSCISYIKLLRNLYKYNKLNTKTKFFKTELSLYKRRCAISSRARGIRLSLSRFSWLSYSKNGLLSNVLLSRW